MNALRILRSGPACPSPARLKRLRASFLRRGYVRLPGFLEPRLRGWVRSRLARARFRIRPGPDANREEVLDPDLAFSLLVLLLNDPVLIRGVEAATGSRVRGFSGRIFRMRPGRGHYSRWHSDWKGGRKVGFRIHLGGPCRGGGLLLRRAREDRPFARVAPASGGAVLYRLGPDLRHRTADLGGSGPLVALDGWFMARAPSVPLPKKAVGSPRPPRAGRKFRSLSDRLVIPPDVIWFGTEPALRICRLPEGRIVVLDGVSSRCWSLLARRLSLPGILARMAREYQVPPDRLRKDLLGLLQQLAGLGFLRVRS